MGLNRSHRPFMYLSKEQYQLLKEAHEFPQQTKKSNSCKHADVQRRLIFIQPDNLILQH